MVEASLKELQTFWDPSVRLSTGPQDDAKNNRGPPRLSYAVSRPKTTVLYLSQVPWLERQTSPPPTMVSGSVFVLNAKIISHSAVFQQWNVTVSCSRWLTLAQTVSRQSAPLLTPQSGLIRFNKCCFFLLWVAVWVFLCAFLAFAGLPRLNIHFGRLLFSTWRDSLNGRLFSAARLPDLPLHFCFSLITHRDPEKDENLATIKFKILLQEQKAAMVAKMQRLKVACAERETN